MTMKEKMSPQKMKLQGSLKSRDEKSKSVLSFVTSGGSSIWCSSRFGLALIGTAGFANVYALRINLSVALVCMLNHTALEGDEIKPNLPPDGIFYPGQDSNSSFLAQNVAPTNKEDGEFVWEKDVQGMILGAFYWGYILTQIPGGILASRLGGKRVFFWAMILTSLCTLLSPLAAHTHYSLLIALRVLAGLSQGVVFPSMHCLLSKWSAPSERSFMASTCYAGCSIGTVLTFPLTALLCDHFGWASAFYVFGLISLVWCAAWYFFVSETPRIHTRIAPEELDYITKSQMGQIEHEKSEKPVNTPWLAMMQSKAVWAIIVAHTTANFGGYLMVTSLPTYMKEALNFNIKSNGLFSALPFLALFFSTNLMGYLSDLIRRKGILSTTNIRKSVILIGFIGQGAFFVGAGYTGPGQEALAVTLFTFAMLMGGFKVSGYMVNHVDIAPQFAGTLLGITNTFANFPGFIAPMAAAALTPNQTREEWQSVFWLAMGILVFGAIFFAVFGSGEIQKWAARPALQPKEAEEEFQKEKLLSRELLDTV